MREAGNFRRRARSNRPVKSPSFLGRGVPGLGLLRQVRQRAEGLPLLFFGVVLGVALLFRGGIGWARSLTAATEPPTEPVKAEVSAAKARLRAEAGGVATVAAVTRARARALLVTRSPAVPAAPSMPAPVAPVATVASADPPSPSFLRAQREFGHRHVEGAVDSPRPLPHLERPVSGRRGRAPRR